MKCTSTILQFALLLVVGMVGAYSETVCSQTVTWTIKNGAVFNNGTQYKVEVWARATDEQILVTTDNFVYLVWNLNALQFVDGTTVIGQIDFAVKWGLPDYDNYSFWVAQPELIYAGFGMKGGQLPSGLSQALPDGELMFSITFKIRNPALAPEFAWGTGLNWITNTGIPGATNTFTIGSNDPLPITLCSFAAIQSGDRNRVQLAWATLSEINNYGFEAQRSFDGKNFVSIAGSFVPGNGTTNHSHTYSYVDANPVGTVSYRLKQMDLDGTLNYSEPVQVTTTTDVKELKPTVFALEQNYPNPFNPSTRIIFSIAEEGPISLRVYDVLGSEVALLVNGNRRPGQYTEQFDGSRLASGVYIYVLRSSEGQRVGRMMLSK